MKLTQVTAASLLVLTGLSLSTTGVYAEEVGTKSTTAVFSIETSEGETPTDPIDPIDPVDPPMGGPLTIDAVSNFNFGTKKLGDGKGSYVAVKSPTKDDETVMSVLGIQVTDNRGSGDGWNVNASITDFKGKDTNILKGAVLTIPAGSLNTNSADITKKPETTGLDLNGKPASIFSAAKDTGMGTWVNLFEGNKGEDGKNKEVTLTVPEGNYVDNYSATITWTLENAPKK